MKNQAQTSRFKFSDRRHKQGLLLVLVLILIGIFVTIEDRSLRHSSFATGYILMGSIVFLAMFNLRKKMPFLPSIGSAATWMQAHIYVGLGTFVIFGFHIGWIIPNGLFEGFLALLSWLSRSAESTDFTSHAWCLVD